MIFFYMSLAIVAVALVFYMMGDGYMEDSFEDMNFKHMTLQELETLGAGLSESISSEKSGNGRRRLIKILKLGYRKIIKVDKYLTDLEKENKKLGAPSQWILDNIYLIEKEYRTVIRNMPFRYYGRLPIDKNGIPRIYSLVSSFIDGSNGEINEENLTRFLNGYMKNGSLNLGELWVLPLMLRLGTIVKISRLSIGIELVEKEKIKGEELAAPFINAISDGDRQNALKDFLNSEHDLTYPLVQRFLKILKDNGIDSKNIERYIEDHLGVTWGETYKVLREVSMTENLLERNLNNCITSLRFIESFNWKDFVEGQSKVEKILREDPSEVYPLMDFVSRDIYRHKIETLAKTFKKSEEFIALSALSLSEVGEENGIKNHIGYYLLDEGVHDLRALLGRKNEKIKSKNKNIYVFLFLNLALTLGLEYVVNYFGGGFNLLLSIIALVPSSQIAITVVNWSVGKIVKPKILPKLDLSKGIDDNMATLVVVPAIIESKERLSKLMEDLEVYHLANPNKNLYYAVLGDFGDSSSKEKIEEAYLLKYGEGIAKQLNNKYGFKFLYLHRERRWNDREKIYMGWERKRGKLIELNKLLRGDKDTSYIVGVNEVNHLPHITYIITLDADTKVPRGTFEKLVGAMSHPLNLPVIIDGKVARGYGVMQPRMKVDVESAYNSYFSKVFSGDKGIDTYTLAVSDVYQDLFKQGIFTGKGIYHIDTFNELEKGKFEENKVLSHDLLEGSLLRCALLSDVTLVDQYPCYYYSSSLRLHRWLRGDIQNLGWAKRKKGLKLLNRYEIADNLRRALFMPTLMLLIIMAVYMRVNSLEVWITLAFISIFASVLLPIGVKGLASALKQSFLSFVFLPHQAYLAIDAIFRATYRMNFSKKNLLQWQPSSQVESSSKISVKGYFKFMGGGEIFALIVALGVVLSENWVKTFMTLPILLWLIAPAIAYYISQPIYHEEELSAEDAVTLRNISRRIWAYFEDFVNEETNYIGADNYQEEPKRGIANRTSPTNIAMTLLSNIIALDLGYIGIYECNQRISKTLNTMMSMDKYKGHLYNWYDTRNLKPLPPKYISTVDSGNLMAYMLLLSRSLQDIKQKPLLDMSKKAGLVDTLRIAMEEKDANSRFGEYIDFLENEITIKEYLDIMVDIRGTLSSQEKEGELNFWSKKLKNMCTANIKEIQVLVPWVYATVSEDTNINRKLILLLQDKSIGELPRELKKFLQEYEYSIKDTELNELIKNSVSSLERLLNDLKAKEKFIDDFISNMDYSFLFNKDRGLLSIGYNADEDKMTDSCYDIITSECRITYFMTISMGLIDKDSWFKLGRELSFMGGGVGLTSWSGTMFEYLMPLLTMRSYRHTLWSETYKNAVKEQIRYGNLKGVPWGISESGYFYFDHNLIYQYKAFGVPRLGLKRGLENDLVVSPYSTIMALMVDKNEGIKNLGRLREIGALGRYGFYESIDYTKERMAKGKDFSIIKSFMIHHHGMSFMALDNVLNGNVLQNRFHKIPYVKSSELLLQEKMCKPITYIRDKNVNMRAIPKEKEGVIVRNYRGGLTLYPEIALLSNGIYNCMITTSGSGVSKVKDLTINRWRDEALDEKWGMFFYIKDRESNKTWNPTYEPMKSLGEDYRVTFALHKAMFRKTYENINSELTISVSGEDNVEIRALTLENMNDEEKVLEITSFLEVTLNSLNGDLSHPAFSNLFIKTEKEDGDIILANRRGRSKGDRSPYLAQVVVVNGEKVSDVTYETSRMNFLGRGNDVDSPKAIIGSTPLQNTVGAVLDPIFSQRVSINLKKGEKSTVYFILALGDNREEVLKLASKYNSISYIVKTIDGTYNNNLLALSDQGIKYKQANLYQMVGSRMLFINNIANYDREHLVYSNRYQRDFWKYGMSGDIPIMTVKIENAQGLDLLRACIQCHGYLNKLGVDYDLLILNMEEETYEMPINHEIHKWISKYGSRGDYRGGIYVQSAKTMDDNDFALICSISRINLIQGRDDAYFNRLSEGEDNFLEPLRGVKSELGAERITSPLQWKKVKYAVEIGESIAPSMDVHEKYEGLYDTSKLSYFNGYGGFDENGAYVIVLRDKKFTPAPWINVLCNDRDFGFHISETGSAYTWSMNSRENKITPWNNDPITDDLGEALYIKDENGEVWSLTQKPFLDDGEYIIRHDFGYSSYTHVKNRVHGKIDWFVPLNKHVKIGMLKLKNNDIKVRNLSITYYGRLVHGVTPQKIGPTIDVKYNEKNKFIYGNNRYSEHFNKTISYLTILGGKDESYTGDRWDFVGRGRGVKNPKGLKDGLNSITGTVTDPALVYSSNIVLGPGEEKEVLILLGADNDLNTVENYVEYYSDLSNGHKDFNEIKDYWNRILGTFKISTPDKTMDIMVNGWLLYQSISCRYLGRSAFYQCGGAMGYRDQLQDSYAIGMVLPEVQKNQILESSKRQFLEGDVQHWWHPIVNSGIRTRFSDDLLWLPYGVIDYINKWGDYSILDIKTTYLYDEELKDGEDEKYKVSECCDIEGTIYEHCTRAIDRSLKVGEHGLPLMGCGDWNDGMSTVGNKGKGESVWVGWFLITILEKFVDICKMKGDETKAEEYRTHREFLIDMVDKNAWDGNWYRRAYFDDGTPLGSAQNDECKIDSLAQSWAVISGAADDKKADRAMTAVEEYLIKEDKGMILLLSPPFDSSNLEPGYIKGYVPGVRENGGQYTHAAMWVILAMAKLKKKDKAWKLYHMVNPINHSKTSIQSNTYKVEPYVMCADVYIREPHGGRGGWTWYTGTSAWYYKVALEWILGFKLVEGKGFYVDPCVPEEWDGFTLTYNKSKDEKYNIEVKFRDKTFAKGIYLNGEKLEADLISFSKGEHNILIVM